MNRRHFFAVTLPALLGWAAPGAFAQDKPTAKPAPRRIRIEISLLKSTLNLGETNAHIIVVVTEEDMETYAAFLQMYTFKENEAEHTVASQAFGPKLSITPHIEADGRIRLNGKVEFEEAVSSAAPSEPLPITTNSLALTRTVTSGQAVTLGGLVLNGVPKQIQVTATLLAPHQAAS